MKKIVFLVLASFIALGLISCAGKGGSNTDESLPFENVGNEPPTQERVAQLIEFLPDHEIISESDSAFAPEYYDLLQQAWAVPSDGIGEIGSDEWLYTLVSGNGGRDPNRTVNIEDINAQGDGAEAIFMLTNYGESREHKLSLIRLDGQWVIADFDGTKIKLKEYIQRQRQYFQSPEWQNYLAPILAPDDEFSQQARERIKEVNRWLKQQPTI